MRARYAWIVGTTMFLGATVARADDTPTFFADPVSHCQVGRFSIGNFTVRWSGACVAGKAEGNGIAEFQKDGAPFSHLEGVFHAGLREGRGLVLLPEGRRTEGEFRGGRLNGRCVVTDPDGSRIDAQCVNDQLTGKGIETWADGKRYEGDFRDSELTGRGIYIWPDGERYEGDFVDSKRQGRGIDSHPDGQRYEGDWDNNVESGRGRLIYADGRWYEGEWRNGLPNGRGVFHSDNGDFGGTWVNGCFANGSQTATLDTTRSACGFD